MSETIDFLHCGNHYNDVYGEWNVKMYQVNNDHNNCNYYNGINVLNATSISILSAECQQQQQLTRKKYKAILQFQLVYWGILIN